MTKRELASETAHQLNIGTGEVERVIDCAIKVAMSKVEDGEEVKIKGFGTLLGKWRKPKTGRNISKGTQISIPGHWVPFFKPSKEFKDRLASI